MVLCNALLPDNTIGLVMDTIQRSGKPFVAIYTELTTEKVAILLIQLLLMIF